MAAQKRKLPEDVIVKQSGYYWRPHSSARLIKLGTDRKEAAEAFNRLKSTGNFSPPDETFDDAMAAAKRALYSSMLKRASDKGLEVLSRDEFDDLWESANGKCQLTGIQFAFHRPPQSLRRPWSPSLDRIDSSLGYSKTNCRIVCTAVNIALNEWGEDILYAVAEALLQHRNKECF